MALYLDVTNRSMLHCLCFQTYIMESESDMSRVKSKSEFNSAGLESGSGL